MKKTGEVERLMTTEEDMEISCDLCEMTFTQACDLRAHLNTGHVSETSLECQSGEVAKTENPKKLERHDDEELPRQMKTFSCEQCDYKTARPDSLKAHVDGVHEKKLKFLCNVCPYFTHASQNIRRHMKTAHERKKPFTCEDCEHSFNSPSDLRRHTEAVHLKIKNFKCEICSYSSYEQRQMRKHTIKVHEKVNSELVSFSATFPSQLKERLNTEHLKSEVGSQFENDESSLRDHNLSSHESEKLNKCEQCDSSFATEYCVKRHTEAVHLKIKNFKCDQCSFCSDSD